MAGIVYLASKSPRRREILSSLGYDVRVEARNAHTLGYFPGDEEVREGETPLAYVVRTARTKFEEGRFLLCEAVRAGRVAPDAVILAADTAVSLGEEILGKPRDAEEAVRFLEALSGVEHCVRTTVVAGRIEGEPLVTTSTSRVFFRRLARTEIDAYVASGEPFDKAGGYGIQGLAGLFVSRIDGSFTGIMGLPVAETGELLARLGLPAIGREP